MNTRDEYSNNSNNYNNSESYFENRSCRYYPCHNEETHLNCMFCYCPMYSYDDCLGEPYIRIKNGKRIKDCTKCCFPHRQDNYKRIIEYLKKINKP